MSVGVSVLPINVRVEEGSLLVEVPEQGYFEWLRDKVEGMSGCPACGTPGVNVSVVVPIKSITIRCTEETCPHYDATMTGATGPGATIEQLHRSDEIVASMQLSARPNVETATIRRVRGRGSR